MYEYVYVYNGKFKKKIATNNKIILLLLEHLNKAKASYT